MSKSHTYRLGLVWTGNGGDGTSTYRSYRRDHELMTTGKPTLLGSSDPSFRGDRTRWNPEELLVGSLSACHMLSYLHEAAMAGVVVTDYRDNPDGVMTEERGTGRFVEVVLRPTVTVAEASMISIAAGLHEMAHAKCFIANSVNFPVRHEPMAHHA